MTTQTNGSGRYNDEQRKAILAEATAGKVSQVCRAHGISATTFYKWKNRFSGLNKPGPKNGKAVPKHQSLKVRRFTEAERLKIILADIVLGNLRVEDLAGKATSH